MVCPYVFTVNCSNSQVVSTMDQSYHFLFAVGLIFLYCTSIAGAPSTEEGECDPDVPSRPLPKPRVLYAALSSGDIKNCPAGEFWHGTMNKCEPCQSGYFMTELMARDVTRTQCEQCYQIDRVVSTARCSSYV